MLNANKERELAYLIIVDAIEPIEGKDRVEAAVVGGWRTMVGKGVFKPGDIGIYFEIDSKLPERPEFEFTAKYHYKIKTQKFKQFYSQGLLMHPTDIGWKVNELEHCVIDNEENDHYPNDESRFLTKQLGVTYAVADDNKRKANPEDKYKKMARRNPKFFAKPIPRWLMRRNWGKKLLFFFFGKKQDKKGGWPAWVVKTDEERCQNLPFIFTNPDWTDVEWYATEKIDGTSTTFTLKKQKSKTLFYVCSRNVCFDTPEKADRCYYDTNVYLEMGQKYNMHEVLQKLLDSNKDLDFVTIQGETYGAGVQKRDYSIKGHDFAAFNLIYGYKDGTTKRENPRVMTDTLVPLGVPCVPIVDEHFKLPASCDELLAIAEGNSKIDGLPREGLVFRDTKGERSFKAVSNKFLIKYHGGD